LPETVELFKFHNILAKGVIMFEYGWFC